MSRLSRPGIGLHLGERVPDGEANGEADGEANGVTGGCGTGVVDGSADGATDGNVNGLADSNVDGVAGGAIDVGVKSNADGIELDVTGGKALDEVDDTVPSRRNSSFCSPVNKFISGKMVSSIMHT